MMYKLKVRNLPQKFTTTGIPLMGFPLPMMIQKDILPRQDTTPTVDMRNTLWINRVANNQPTSQYAFSLNKDTDTTRTPPPSSTESSEPTTPQTQQHEDPRHTYPISSDNESYNATTSMSEGTQTDEASRRRVRVKHKGDTPERRKNKHLGGTGDGDKTA